MNLSKNKKKYNNPFFFLVLSVNAQYFVLYKIYHEYKCVCHDKRFLQHFTKWHV